MLDSAFKNTNKQGGAYNTVLTDANSSRLGLVEGYYVQLWGNMAKLLVDLL
jgi:hypothetical protein